MCLLVIKYSIPITIGGSMPDKVNAKSFSAEVADGFIKSDKVKVNTHLSKLIVTSRSRRYGDITATDIHR